MWTTPLAAPVSMQLPLMYAAPNRTLAYAHALADSLYRFDQIRRTAEARGISMSLLYSYAEPGQARYFGAMVLDFTLATVDVQQAAQELAGIPGVEMCAIAAPARGLAAWRGQRLEVTRTPVAVISRQFLGGTHRYLIEALGEQVEALLYGAGVLAGRQIGERVPAVLTRLGVPLSTAFLQERIRDLQVFGWAEIVSLQIDDSLAGEVLLSDAFEATAWQGHSDRPRCNWLRGFLMGSLASLGRKPMTVAETACQAQGDPHCRMLLRPAGS